MRRLLYRLLSSAIIKCKQEGYGGRLFWCCCWWIIAPLSFFRNSAYTSYSRLFSMLVAFCASKTWDIWKTFHFWSLSLHTIREVNFRAWNLDFVPKIELGKHQENDNFGQFLEKDPKFVNFLAFQVQNFRQNHIWIFGQKMKISSSAVWVIDALS